MFPVCMAKVNEKGGSPHNILRTMLHFEVVLGCVIYYLQYILLYILLYTTILLMVLLLRLLFLYPMMTCGGGLLDQFMTNYA